ncbi:MAG: hypothetical protein NXI17_02630 [Alphaproteobacteria bacterium]|nr:hypothetical protein [Alphaproteobacteria bacterium]
MLYAKIGATAYALWSILHIILGVIRLADRAADGALAEATGRLAQGHWTLFYIGVFGLIASYYNWKNNPIAYWVAAFIISAEDIGFILFPVIYGGTPFPASVIGPGLWLAGLVFTTLAYNQSRSHA